MGIGLAQRVDQIKGPRSLWRYHAEVALIGAVVGLVVAVPRTRRCLFGLLGSAFWRRRLEAFLSARSPAGARLRYAMAGGAYRQRLVDNLIYRSLYLAKRI